MTGLQCKRFEHTRYLPAPPVTSSLSQPPSPPAKNYKQVGSEGCVCGGAGGSGGSGGWSSGHEALKEQQEDDLPINDK